VRAEKEVTMAAREQQHVADDLDPSSLLDLPPLQSDDPAHNRE
jgi:hypothetical protein